MIIDEGDYLEHYGILRKSGRYPWGSGNTQSARNQTFLDTVRDLQKNHGMTKAEIAKAFSTDDHPLTSTHINAAISIAVNQQRQEKLNLIYKYAETGMSTNAIAKKMGLNESTVRSLRKQAEEGKVEVLRATAEMLKREVEEKSWVDVGAEVNRHAGVSKDKFRTAVAMLKEEGYEVHKLRMPQQTNDKLTTFLVLAKPGTKQSDAWAHRHDIKQIDKVSSDGGKTFQSLKPPISISSKRIGINYAENGGAKADGVIYVRPGVKDVSLGKNQYAQVRIAVDGTHFLKGMAVYKDDLPAGTDLVFNTNKSNTGNKKDAMKEMKTDDPVNPFGAAIKIGGQLLDKDGKVTSVMNIINEEGDWDKWSNVLSSQMLSKQKPELAKQQLDTTYERRRKEFEEIKGLTNPAVKRKLLETFGDETDSAAVHLKAANIPRQASKVIMPVPSMKETEIYAPSFRNGERVALVRHPHGGTFEIPELTVNNRNPEARKLLGPQAKDAIGINHKVAERLSGADFDGDHVIVIPNDRSQVKSTSPLEGLRNFDPKLSHPPYEGMRTIDGGTVVQVKPTVKVDYGKKADGSPRDPTDLKQTEMGKVSNLITDMTIKGASPSEIARAVRHSMVVIDSEKHVLDYKGSFEQNGISALKTKYQKEPGQRGPGGASTIISRAGSDARIPHRVARPASQGGPIDPKTGKKVFVDTGRTVTNRRGETQLKLQKHDLLAITDNAHDLVSKPHGTTMEKLYADHSNRLKALANESRKELLTVKSTPMNESAKKTYAAEVASLNAKLNLALKNAPLERQAQVVSDAMVRQRMQANPHLDKDDKKKIKNQALAEARARTGAGKTRIKFEGREWDAIQAGAISNNKLEDILRNSDLDKVRELATPREKLLMTSTSMSRARGMINQGYTQAEIAEQLGVSLTTLKANLNQAA